MADDVIDIYNGSRDIMSTSDIFGDQSALYDKLCKSCKELLLSRGYKVVDPMKFKYVVTKVDDLISLFYNLYEFHYPEKTFGKKSLARNRRMMGLFIKSRMNGGSITRKSAMNECANIIRTIFEHYTEFKFTAAVSIDMLGQDAFGWVTDKAVNIIDASEKSKREADTEKAFDSYELSREQELGLGVGRLDALFKSKGV